MKRQQIALQTSAQTEPPSDTALQLEDVRMGRRVMPVLAGRVATMLAQFASLTLIARAIGPSDFGLLQLALVAFAYLTLLADLGVSILATRDNAGRAREDLGVYVGARLVLAVTVTGVAVAGLVFIEMDREATVVVAVLCIGLVASALNVRWLLQARERFNRIAIIDVMAACAQTAGALGMWLWARDITWAAVVMIVAPCLSATGTMIASRNSGLTVRISASTVAVIRRALPAGIAVLATSIYFNIDSLLLGIFRDPSEIGYYAAAYRLVLAALAAATVANAVAIPILTRATKDAPRAIPAALSELSSALLWLALPLAVATSIGSPVLVTFVFGDAFAPAAVPLAILVWTVVTVSANTPFAALMLARRQDRRYMLIMLAGGATNIALNLILIPRFGTIGAAATAILTEVMVLSLVIGSTLDMSPKILLRSVWSAILPTMTVAIAVWMLREHPGAILLVLVTVGIAGAVVGPFQPVRLRELISPRGTPAQIDS